MLALLLSSVSAAAILSLPPSNLGFPATPHNMPTATYWRCRFTGGGSGAYFSVASLEFRDTHGGATITSGGTPIASGERVGFEKGLAFDGDSATKWSVDRPPVEAWLGYQFAVPVTVREVAITSATTDQSHTPTDLAVECSQDGVTWELVEVFFKDSGWSSGETVAFSMGSGAFNTRTPRTGSTTLRNDEVMGQVFHAEADFSITAVHTYLLSPIVTQAAVVLVDSGTYAITEVLSVSDPGPDSSVPTISIPPCHIEAGQTFAILVYSSESETIKNVKVRYISDDFSPIVASPVANWLQVSKNVAVGVSPDATSDTGDTLVYFTGVYRNGVGDFPEGVYPVPDFVPFPAAWYSPENVVTDGGGIITSIPNLGWRGSAEDATPSAGKQVTVREDYEFWGERKVFDIPDSYGGFVAGTGFLAQSFVTVATYGPETSPNAVFDTYAGLVSGLSNGSTSELEIVGHAGQPYFFSGKVDTIMVGEDVYDDAERRPILPLHKKAVGGTEDAEHYYFGYLWADNFSTDRNWHGTTGDVMVFVEPLTDEQLILIGRSLSTHFEPSPEVTTVSASSIIILGGGRDGSVTASKAQSYAILGGGGQGQVGINTHNTYAIIQE